MGRRIKVPKMRQEVSGNLHTHLAVFTKIDTILVYVCKYAKNNQRRKVRVNTPHPPAGGWGV